MKLLLPPLLLCLVTCLLVVLDARHVIDQFSAANGLKLAVVLVCLYGSGYLLYRIVSIFNDYRENIDYQ